MDTTQYVIDECDRQEATNYDDFQAAMDAAKKSRIGFDIDSPETLGHFVCHLANKVDPANTYHAGTDLRNLRTSHVGFRDGGTAAPTHEVPERFQRWCNLAYVVVTNDSWVESFSDDVDIIIKMLLEIHPWKDGNGRTASILRNWMLGTLDAPQPLPYYFGQS